MAAVAAAARGAAGGGAAAEDAAPAADADAPVAEVPMSATRVVVSLFVGVWVCEKETDEALGADVFFNLFF